MTAMIMSWLGSRTLNNSITALKRYKCTSTTIINPILRTKLRHPIASAYDPLTVENGWEEFWKSTPPIEKNKKNFSMLLPPPNVTGVLHIGHALTVAIQDSLARWHAMQGYNVSWLPGLDHAGIATQAVVEKSLDVSRHEIGRKEFVSKVWDWKERHGSVIMNQISALGASCDFKSTTFTMDEHHSKAVTEAFIQLYNDGLIYRDMRMVNWCPKLQSVISDIEVDTVTVTGKSVINQIEVGVMHRFTYKVFNSDKTLEVDTTRPETILGDVAVAVHPDDERYKDFHHKFVIHPVTKEKLPIITDAILVNPELGTGVVKLTPSHDESDYDAVCRYNTQNSKKLEFPKMMDTKGYTINHPEFTNLEARTTGRCAMIAFLKQEGLYIESYDHPTSVKICSRTSDVIEPMLMPQWFIKMKDLAESALDAVSSGKLQITPKDPHTQVWNNWLRNSKDWCISRQLWWGHSIPAFQDQISNKWIVAKSLEEAQATESSNNLLIQDEDVLDTWFSSALLPLSVSGWPMTSNELSDTYPLSTMETGHDILFFWVARMVMICTHLSKDKKTLPFNNVLLHPMVRDKDGRKMSKSVGNVIDPLDVIYGKPKDEMLLDLENRKQRLTLEEYKKSKKKLSSEYPNGIPSCGADALRFTLASYMQQGRQINMDINRVVASRHFCNKLWNAVKYTLMHLENQTEDVVKDKNDVVLVDEWILQRLSLTIEQVNEGMKTFDIARCTSSLHRFIISDLCDVYIEFSKKRLYNNDHSDKEAIQVLFHTVESSLRILHPFMPHVTEELWQRLQRENPNSEKVFNDERSLRDVPFPTRATTESSRVEDEMKTVLQTLHGIRSLKVLYQKLSDKSSGSTTPVVTITSSEKDDATSLLTLLQNQEDLEIQGKVSLNIKTTDTSLETDTSFSSIKSTIGKRGGSNITISMKLENSSSTRDRVAGEKKRLTEKIKKTVSQISSVKKRLQSKNFIARAPEEVVNAENQKLKRLENEITELEQNLLNLTEIQF